MVAITSVNAGEGRRFPSGTLPGACPTPPLSWWKAWPKPTGRSRPSTESTSCRWRYVPTAGAPEPVPWRPARSFPARVASRLVQQAMPALRNVRAQVALYALAWETSNVAALAPGAAAAGPLWVVLGDSTAQGIGASGHDKGYVGQLHRILEERTGKTWRVLNLSKSGARAADVWPPSCLGWRPSAPSPTWSRSPSARTTSSAARRWTRSSGSCGRSSPGCPPARSWGRCRRDSGPSGWRP